MNFDVDRTIEEVEIELAEYGLCVSSFDVVINVDYEEYDPGVHTFSNGDPGYPPSGGCGEATSFGAVTNVVVCTVDGVDVDWASLRQVQKWKAIYAIRKEYDNNEWLESQGEWATEAAQEEGERQEEHYLSAQEEKWERKVEQDYLR
tara:strand:+ start:499 stop:939 length:441 start_codon:yes stop_codon:yes gene_type:complete